MILSMTFQCRLFILSALLGIAGGFAYTFIVSAAMIWNKRALKHICDIVFWLSYALGIFLVMLRVNYGEIRPFSILGIFIGMVIYYAAFEEYVRRITAFILKTAVKSISTFIEIVLTPFKILLFPFRKLTIYLKKTCKNIKSMRK